MAKGRNLIGNIYGMLLVQERTKERHPLSGEVIWKCKCNGCNSICKLQTSELTRRGRQTCGCKKIKETHFNAKYPGGFKPQQVEKFRERKFKNRIGDLSSEKRFNLLSDYLKGISVFELQALHDTSKTDINRFITDLRNKLNQTYELNYLTTMENVPVSTTKLEKVLQTKFTSLQLNKYISGNEAKVLTNEELLYATLFVKSGSNNVALKDSGFEKCLKVKDPVRKKLLGYYLREKSNIASYIKELQAIQIAELDVTKDTVQSELVNQITQLKEIVSSDDSNPAQRGQLLKAIEMLGKTIGAFQDRIQVEEVDPSKALDELLEMTKVPSTYSVEDVQ